MPFVDDHCVVAAAGGLVPASLNDWNDDARCDEESVVAVQSSCLEASPGAAPSDPMEFRQVDSH